MMMAGGAPPRRSYASMRARSYTTEPPPQQFDAQGESWLDRPMQPPPPQQPTGFDAFARNLGRPRYDYGAPPRV